MTKRNLKCPKCNAEMEEGFILDKGDSGALQSRWVEGEPEKTSLFGVKTTWFGVNTSGKEILQVTTYRCTGCGFLESYASQAD